MPRIDVVSFSARRMPSGRKRWTAADSTGTWMRMTASSPHSRATCSSRKVAPSPPGTARGAKRRPSGVLTCIR